VYLVHKRRIDGVAHEAVINLLEICDHDVFAEKVKAKGSQNA